MQKIQSLGFGDQQVHVWRIELWAYIMEALGLEPCTINSDTGVYAETVYLNDVAHDAFKDFSFKMRSIGGLVPKPFDIEGQSGVNHKLMTMVIEIYNHLIEQTCLHQQEWNTHGMLAF